MRFFDLLKNEGFSYIEETTIGPEAGRTHYRYTGRNPVFYDSVVDVNPDIEDTSWVVGIAWENDFDCVKSVSFENIDSFKAFLSNSGKH